MKLFKNAGMDDEYIKFYGPQSDVTHGNDVVSCLRFEDKVISIQYDYDDNQVTHFLEKYLDVAEDKIEEFYKNQSQKS